MIIPILLLLSLSIAVIYTSDPQMAISQGIFGLLGLGLFFLLKNFDYRALKPFIIPSYIAIIIFLVITFIIGAETRGSVRWISIGPFNFQPSEFAKPVLILALAAFWSSHIPSWKNILKSVGILAPIFFMVFEQPDLGTTLTIGFIWLSILIGANLSWIKMMIMGAFGSAIIPFGWFFLEEYQKQRIFSFLSPSSDPKGIGFHAIQASIAIGSGQLFGRGLGRGTQSRLQFLPEFRTDFIFAFIAEELGFLGSMIVLFLYSITFFILFRLLSRVGDKFGELIIVGVAGMIFFQMTVNIGMNIGIMPITGITLPLLSYGGSSIVTTLLSFGLVASVAKHGLKRKETPVFSV